MPLQVPSIGSAFQSPMQARSVAGSEVGAMARAQIGGFRSNSVLALANPLSTNGIDSYRGNFLALLDNSLAADTVLICGVDGAEVMAHKCVFEDFSFVPPILV